MNNNDKELRQWCIEKAIESGAGTNCVEEAEKLYQFTQNGAETTPLKDAKSLTDNQKKVLKAMMELGEEANGSSLGRHLDITQSYASSILRKLISLGYVSREGNKFWVVRHPEISGDQ